MRLSFSTLLMVCPFLMNSLCADNPASANKQNANQDCIAKTHPMHVGVRHTEARGVGYETGYTTLEAFGIYDHYNHFMPFLDIRGHVFDNGKFAGNVGIGERTALFSIDHLLGTYVYYDVRQENHHLTVNQVSPGIELVGGRMEYRINGYFPVGRTKSRKYHRAFDRFKGNNIIVKTKQKQAMTGGDAEIGVHMTQSTTYDAYLAAGPYYFNSANASSWGGKVRLLGRYKEYVSLEASYSYDHLFRSVVQGTIGFNYPFGGKLKRRDKNCAGQNNLWFSRAAFAPQRFEIPVVKRVTRHSKAINPATGAPWIVWFVNNTSHSLGTIESPFSTLAAAQNASSPGDAIYVFPGDGTTTGMDQGIALQDQQKLFGSGMKQIFPTTKGSLSVPAQSASSPTITNTIHGISGVNLGNDCEVAGLVISNINGGNAINGGPSAIIPNSAGIIDAYIHDNILINNTVTNGVISFHNCSGSLIMENNTIDGVINAGLGGIVSGINVFTDNVPVSASFIFRNNVIHNVNPTSPGSAIWLDISASGNTQVLAENNSFNNVYRALYVQGSNSMTAQATICATFIGNQINQTTLPAINLNSLQKSSVYATVLNNTITNSAQEGVFATCSTGCSLTLQLRNNSSSKGYTLSQAGTGVFTLMLPFTGEGSPLTQTGSIQVSDGHVVCPFSQ